MKKNGQIFFILFLVLLSVLNIKPSFNVYTLDCINTIPTNNKKAVITGITGQDGAYLTKFLLEKGYTVFGLVRRSSSSYNTERLNIILKQAPQNIKNNLVLIYGDVTDYYCVSKIINIVKPDEVYNLAAQSHVKISFEKPIYTAMVDGIGALNMLEAIRNSGLDKKIKFYQASTSELYGKVIETPQTENTPFHPRSPYAVAKLFAHTIVINYREAYGMFACNGILFNHESPLRGDDFVTRVITQGVAKIKLGLEKTMIIGNLNAKRDWGFAGDYVEAMWLMLQQDAPDDYVIATGETHSVREFIELAFKEIGVEIEWQAHGIHEIGVDKATDKTLITVDKRFFRLTEVDVLKGDASKAQKKLNWKPTISFEELVKTMLKSELELLKKNKN